MKSKNKNLKTVSNNKTMTIEEKAEVRDWVQEQLKMMPVTKLAELTGINHRYIYELRSGTYSGCTDKIFENMRECMGLNIHNAWVLANTHNLGIAAGTFQKAQVEKLCLGLTGITGFGKTEAARLYAKKNKDVIYVHCNTEMSKLDFLAAISKQLNIPPQYRRTMNQLVKSIIAHMITLDSPLLLIDDAGKLNNAAFRMFQLLFDESVGKVGFVLLGVPEFKIKVFKNADKGVFCYKEIARRIGWVTMGNLYRSDIEAVCVKNGINDESAISYLCDNVGDLDTLKRLVKSAKLAAKKSGDAVISRQLLAEKVGTTVESYRVSYVM